MCAVMLRSIDTINWDYMIFTHNIRHVAPHLLLLECIHGKAALNYKKQTHSKIDWFKISLSKKTQD